jgi:hypothetical protein
MSSSLRKDLPLQILVYAYFPGRCLVQVHVQRDSPVSELHGLFPSEALSFIANGVSLCDQNTFDFYSIRDRDVVVALPAGSDVALVRKWSLVTDDSDTFAEKIGYLINHETSREVGRLRDFQMMRVERRPRSFRKLVSAYQNSHGRVASSPQASFTVPSAPVTPNVDPLPTFWRTEAMTTTVGSTEPLTVLKDEQIVSEQSPETLQP